MELFPPVPYQTLQTWCLVYFLSDFLVKELQNLSSCLPSQPFMFSLLFPSFPYPVAFIPLAKTMALAYKVAIDFPFLQPHMVHLLQDCVDAQTHVLILSPAQNA